ncbi:MAG TPA: rod shape-determining protein RodA, partial [Acidimicrobiales bacterium]
MTTPTLARKPIANLQRSQADPRAHIDWVMLAATVLLAAVGLLAVYTAKARNIELSGGDPLYYVKRQAVALVLGGVGMLVVMAISYRRLRDFAFVFYLGTAGLLMGVLLKGSTVNGAEAWFNIGPFQLQPSEFAKVTLVLTLAAYLARERGGSLPHNRFVGSLVILALPAGLVLLQPDLGTASVLVSITMGILLVAGASWRAIAAVSLMALISVAAVLGTGTLDSYQKDRITAFMNQNPTKDNRDIVLQVQNSKTAIAAGGITGEGYLDGAYTNGGYVPEQHTDFVFSAIGEQFGMLGGAALLLLYGILGWRVWRTARMSKDQLGMLICAGALTMLAWHVFENVGMTMGITPVTGIPLPLVSYGGSSVIATLALLGL